jgi:hypothetical protein
MKLISKFGRTLAFLVFFYQFISITILYLKYETVIHMMATPDGGQRPTVTFCLKNNDEFGGNNLGLAFSKFDGPIICSVKGQYGSCSKLTTIVESVTPHSQRCLSYFSQLFDENPSPKELGFLIPNQINAFALIHQNSTPPHFTNYKIEIPESSQTLIGYTSVTVKLLPFPYSTDCYDYKREEKSLIRFKSREDCIVKHLERIEFDRCGCNKGWSYKSYNTQNFTYICPKAVKFRFNSKILINHSEKICKNNCLNQYFYDIITSSQYMTQLSMDQIKSFSPYKTRKNEIVCTHLPKMNLVEYLSSTGGLIMMWYGMICIQSFYYFVLTLMRKVIINRFGLIKFKMKKYIPIIFNHIYSIITIVVFMALMVYQISALIKAYLNYEIVTRLQVQEIVSIPSIIISMKSRNTSQMAKELKDIYPEIEEISSLRDFGPLQRKMLYENKVNDFRRIFGSEKIIKTCHIIIANKVINFSNFDSGVFEFNDQLFLFNRLNYPMIDKNRIEKTTISLYDFDVSNVVLEPFTDNHYSFDVKKHFEHKVTFQSFLTQRLNVDQNCISEDNANKFREDYFQFCFNDCYVKKTNDIYGCFPSNGVYFYFKRYGRYKYCNDSHLYHNQPVIHKIYEICKTECKPKCSSIQLVFKLEVSNPMSMETILEFIPDKTPRIAYIETLKTDLNRLICNCGGIFGLWVCLTPIKALDLYLCQICLFLKVKILKIVQHFK